MPEPEDATEHNHHPPLRQRLRLPPLPAGAILYPSGLAVDGLLADFAATLAGRGFRVGGLVQRNTAGTHPGTTLMELVDVTTGKAVAISQNLGAGSVSCRVDPGGVAEASQTLRRALAERVDLLVVNKFAGLEKEGRGLAPEILAAMAEGIPVLIGVGSRFLGEWQTFCGGTSRLLPPEPAALWQWWGGERLYPDLVHAAVAVAGTRHVTQIVCQPPWLLVVDDTGAGGLARLPENGGSRSGDSSQLLAWKGRSLTAVIALLQKTWDPVLTCLGLAAVNAALNSPTAWPEETASSGNGLDAFTGGDLETEIPDTDTAETPADSETVPPSHPLVVVGNFARIAGRHPRSAVITAHPAAGQYPLPAAEWLLPEATAVVLSAATLPERTLPGLLRRAGGRSVALVGPDTPLTPRLFSYGLTILGGRVITNAIGLADALRSPPSSSQGPVLTHAVLDRYSHRVILDQESFPFISTTAEGK